MFIREKTLKNKSKSVQIVGSVRDGKKVSQKILQHIGIAKNDKDLIELKALAQQALNFLKAEKKAHTPEQPILPFMKDFVEQQSYETSVSQDAKETLTDLEYEDIVIDGPMQVVERLFQYLGLNRIFSNPKRAMGKVTLLKHVLAASLVFSSSKRKMARQMNQYMGIETSLASLYRFTDALADNEEKIKQVVKENSQQLLASTPSLMLFDVTTLYFESSEEVEGALRQKGYSKDGKFKETQVVLALATTPEGLPLWYNLYSGKTWEGATFLDFANTWRRAEYPETPGVVVADSGMFSKINLSSLEENGLDYVIGARLKNLPQKEQKIFLNMEDYKALNYTDNDGATHEELKYKVMAYEDGKNLLVVWSSRRAAKDVHDREKLLDRLKKKLNKKDILHGKQLVNNRGSSRYLKLMEGEELNTYVINEDKIAEDAKWDGLRGVITRLPLTTKDEINAVLAHYHSLWRIEESFRIEKTDLKIRPIFHWTDKRIRGHIALKYLTFAVMRHLQKRLEVQQGESLSIEAIQEALLKINSVLMRNKKDNKLYRWPKKLTGIGKKLYKSLGICYSTAPREIISLNLYRRRRSYKNLADTTDF